MSSCSGIRADGGRCKAQAIRDSDLCFNHHPDFEAARRKRATRGGKRGGRGRPVGELGALRAENAEIRERLLGGKLKPGVAAVAIQSINTDIRAVATSLRVVEQERLIERLESLEESLESRKGDHWYGT